ncbi:hypothetical protein [Paraburkholderia domus]|uniref:hypothetical protein n=1 Tax=Paraburkholderia domus TaxID=2793075 RepID=UPI00191184FB|nr:hypothetical protein [Paraburkholderia domus]MBK5066370.1 hypothetical protein [Burkholderia sp. R-70199]CAE6969718.1 hypothetical protein R70199_08106 [Paraburkholderia domus]
MEDYGFTPVSDEVKQHHDKIIAEALKKGSYGMKLAGRAAQSASAFAESDGLHRAIDEYGDYRYRVQQGRHKSFGVDASAGAMEALAVSGFLRVACSG